MKKQCKVCKFNFDNVCAGHGNIYKYGEEILDDSLCCSGWAANEEYFRYVISVAPRFLNEAFYDCNITGGEYFTLWETYNEGEPVEINLFDAIKCVYGISMVDIAVLMNVSYGVVYRAKHKGIPQKRIKQFSDLLCIDRNLLSASTTDIFEYLENAKDKFWTKVNLNKIEEVPKWKEKLAIELKSFVFDCSIEEAKDFARIDKLYWREGCSLEMFTESELRLIKYLSEGNNGKATCVQLEYYLDIAGLPHINIIEKKNMDSVKFDE